MQKYIKNDLSEIRYFEDDVIVSDWIDLTQYRLMTDEEILKHETNPHTDYHVWNGTEWLDSRTQEQIVEYEHSLIPAITKRQFALALDDYEKYDEVMSLLESDRRAKIEFDSVSVIERLSPTVVAMTALLNVSDEYVDTFFEYARMTYS